MAVALPHAIRRSRGRSPIRGGMRAALACAVRAQACAAPGRREAGAVVLLGYCGLMFWLRWNRLAGS